MFSYLYHGHGHLDHFPVEIFSIKPLDGRLCSVGIIIGHGSFSLGQPSVVIFVDEDSLIPSFPVVLDNSDGPEELSDVLRCGVSRKALDKYLVV